MYNVDASGLPLNATILTVRSIVLCSLRRASRHQMSRFPRRVTATHTMRYHAHYHSSGEGHVYQGRFKSFPIQDDEHFLTVCQYVERNARRAELVRRAEHWRWGSLWRWLQKTEPEPALLSSWPILRLPQWVERVNAPLTDGELTAIRKSAQRGSPFGTPSWIESNVKAFRFGVYGASTWPSPGSIPRRNSKQVPPL